VEKWKWSLSNLSCDVRGPSLAKRYSLGMGEKDGRGHDNAFKTIIGSYTMKATPRICYV